MTASEEEADELVTDDEPLQQPEQSETVVDAAENEDVTASLEFRYSISSYGADYPVDALVQRLNSTAVRIPDFQRKYVWNTAQASKFIESLLLGLPVPGIFLAKEPKTGKLLVVDGQQRLRTLQYFYAGHFESSKPPKRGRKFKLHGVAPAFEGRTYATLDEAARQKLDDSIIHATVVKQDFPPGGMTGIYQIFKRLNTGGVKLYPQEIRASVYHGEFNRVLAELNQTPSWRNIYGVESRRMKDRELILRFFALYFNGENYHRPMESALNDFMQSNANLEKVPEAVLRSTFVTAIDLAYTALGERAFHPLNVLNAAVFDASLVGLARRLERSPAPEPTAVAAAYAELLQDADFRSAWVRSTSDDEQVKKRLAIATDAFGRI